MKLNATIDFYEYGHDSDEELSPKTKYFGRLPSFWAEKASELESEGASMILSSFKDDNFDGELSLQGIRSHISVMSAEQRESGLSIDIEEARGYGRR